MTRLLKSHGLVMTDAQQRRAYVPIAKNASNSITAALQNQGWYHVQTTQADLDIQELVVVLRDPVQRWISGVAQYLRTTVLNPVGPNGPVFDKANATEHDYSMTPEQFGHLYNDLVERILFDKLDRFDDHVWPQCDFVPDLPRARHRYIIMDQEFERELQTSLNISVADLNNSKHDRTLRKLQQWFQQRLAARPELVQRIQDRYQQDYILIREAHALRTR
jgi:hypothetical protein